MLAVLRDRFIKRPFLGVSLARSLNTRLTVQGPRAKGIDISSNVTADDWKYFITAIIRLNILYWTVNVYIHSDFRIQLFYVILSELETRPCPDLTKSAVLVGYQFLEIFTFFNIIMTRITMTLFKSFCIYFSTLSYKIIF
jgi:hypothetical protein